MKPYVIYPTHCGFAWSDYRDNRYSIILWLGGWYIVIGEEHTGDLTKLLKTAAIFKSRCFVCGPDKKQLAELYHEN